MLTRIAINGFKSFRNFSMDLAPFTVVAGLNAVGKSNLFDAIRLLSSLASDEGILTAFSEQRGDAYELFSVEADGTHSTRMEFRVELFLDGKVKDSWGGEADLKYRRLEYLLEIRRGKDERGIERLYVEKEALALIKRGEDGWYKRFASNWKMNKVTGGRAPFISTDNDGTITLHQDNGSKGRLRPAIDLQSTMLSIATTIEFPHALAVRDELANWKFLRLNPEALRTPSKMNGKSTLGIDGAHLAATLYRIKTDAPAALRHISRDMARMVNDIVEIDVRADETEKRYVLFAKTRDGHSFSSLVLSEGTLRIIALCTLRYDPTHNGLFCFEEPENGIHPERMRALVSLLMGLSTDFEQPEERPLRQVIVNTHSPVFIRALVESMETENGHRANLFLAHLKTVVTPKVGITKATTMASANIIPQMEMMGSPPQSEAERKITHLELLNILETHSVYPAQ